MSESQYSTVCWKTTYVCGFHLEIRRLNRRDSDESSPHTDGAPTIGFVTSVVIQVELVSKWHRGITGQRYECFKLHCALHSYWQIVTAIVARLTHCTRLTRLATRSYYMIDRCTNTPSSSFTSNTLTVPGRRMRVQGGQASRRP